MYPDDLCKAFLDGLKLQKEWDGENMGLLMRDDCDGFAGHVA